MLPPFIKGRFFVKWYSKPSIHLWSKLILLSCTMQETPLKSPNELHRRRRKQNSSFQKEILSFSTQSIQLRISLLHATCSGWQSKRRSMVIELCQWKEQSVSKVTLQSSAEAPVPSPPFNVNETYSEPLDPKSKQNSVIYVLQQTRAR